MKKTIYGLLLLTGILTATSCKDKQGDTPPVKEEPPIENVTQVLRSADSAKQDIAYFDTICAALTTDSAGAIAANSPIKAFTVRAVDLLAAMGMQPGDAPNLQYDHVRVYLGYNKAASNFKLYIVPVAQATINNQQAGQDLVLNQEGQPIQPQEHYPAGYLNDKFVLDLNAPCPNLCDVTTPLMNNNQ